jgi:hypothetical protein
MGEFDDFTVDADFAGDMDGSSADSAYEDRFPVTEPKKKAA